MQSFCMYMRILGKCNIAKLVEIPEQIGGPFWFPNQNIEHMSS